MKHFKILLILSVVNLIILMIVATIYGWIYGFNVQVKEWLNYYAVSTFIFFALSAMLYLIKKGIVKDIINWINE